MVRKRLISLITTVATLVTMTMPATLTAAADDSLVGVIKGPTPIFEGAATANDDITIYNDKIAVSFAVGSNNYWNMTRGSILDIGIRNDGGNAYGADMTNDAEFLMDLWTATGSYKGENLLTDVDCDYKTTGDTVTVTMKTRFWVADADKNGVDDEQQFGALQAPLNVTSTYELKAGDWFVTMHTDIENPASNKVTYADMYSGYSISTLAQSMYGPYGFYPEVKTTGINIGKAKDVQEAFGEFVVTYSPDYAVSVQMDDADSYKGSSGYKDIYKHQNLEPGKTYGFQGELLVSDQSETASIMDRYIAREGIADTATLSGVVKDASGKPVSDAYVILEKTGVYQQTAKSAGYTAGFEDGKVVANMQPFLWFKTDADGKYSFNLPKTGYADGTANILGNGDYTYKLKVEAAGYTTYESDLITLSEDTAQDISLESGAKIHLTAVDQNGNKIPFKVTITGLTSEMKTLGGSVYFSDAFASDKYSVDFNMSQAKNITFTATYDASYDSAPVSFTTDVTKSGVSHKFVIDRKVDLHQAGWYQMDNHNHSDYGDGSTTIQDLYSIQIAQGLDFNLVSDHDTRTHNKEMAGFAKADGREFLSNIEISPGWGHWGAIGVDYSSADAFVNPSTATPKEIQKASHDRGAISIMHHPYSDYGFLNNQESVKGGNEEGWDGFDLLELQDTIDLSELSGLTAEDWKTIDKNHLAKTMPSTITNMDAKTVVSAMAFWNNGQKKYFSAGSDAHDAHNAKLFSGVIREFAHLGTDYSAKAYLDAISAGDSYITSAPIILPDEETTHFGTTLEAGKNDALKFKMQVMSVNGLDKVYLYRNGLCIDTKDLNGATDLQDVLFETTSTGKANEWYTFVVGDKNGEWAITNPIWVAGGEAVEEPAAGTFSDVASTSWFHDAVMDVVGKGLMNGTSADKFSPNATLTRGMVATVLYRIDGAKGGTASEAAGTFSDVAEGKWYAEAVDWAADNSIVKGYDGKFSPETEITRQDMVTILERYVAYKGGDVTASADISAYTDASDVAAYAQDAVKWAVGAGYMNGRTETTLAPKGNMTRAEFATIISRFSK